MQPASQSALYYTTLHYTILHYTILHYTTLYYTILYYTTLYYTTLHYTILYYTTLHYTTLHYTTLHCTTLHYTILHYTTLYYTTLHYTVQVAVLMIIILTDRNLNNAVCPLILLDCKNMNFDQGSRSGYILHNRHYSSFINKVTIQLNHAPPFTDNNFHHYHGLYTHSHPYTYLAIQPNCIAS